MNTIFNNLINGNLTDAKRQAKSYTFSDLMFHGRDSMGYSKKLAEAAALYLKGKIPFQEYCDIEFAEKAKK